MVTAREDGRRHSFLCDLTRVYIRGSTSSSRYEPCCGLVALMHTMIVATAILQSDEIVHICSLSFGSPLGLGLSILRHDLLQRLSWLIMSIHGVIQSWKRLIFFEPRLWSCHRAGCDIARVSLKVGILCQQSKPCKEHSRQQL